MQSVPVKEDPSLDLGEPDATQWLCRTIYRQGFHKSVIRSALGLSDLLLYDAFGQSAMLTGGLRGGLS